MFRLLSVPDNFNSASVFHYKDNQSQKPQDRKKSKADDLDCQASNTLVGRKEDDGHKGM